MRKFFLILAAVYAAFLVESLSAKYLGRWFSPNLLLTVVIFFNLSRGTRYSLLAAVLAGLLKDSFVPRGFGFFTFSFISCAFLTSFLKVYIYQTGSMASRALVLFIALLVNAHILFLLNLISLDVSYWEMLRDILLPEALATMAVSAYVFEKFKSCVLRYFV